MGYIHVANDDNRLQGIEFLYKGLEKLLPAHTHFQINQFTSRIRYIDIYQIEFLILGCDHATNIIVILVSDAVLHIDWHYFTIYGNASISTRHTQPVGMIARQTGHLLGQLIISALSFLKQSSK